MPNIILVFLTLCSFIFISCSGLQMSGGKGPYAGMSQEPDFDRTGFGNSPLPIWSALTDAEIAALKGADKAAAGDPDALLALAVFASGDKREAADYLAIRTRIKTFLDKIRPEIAAEKTSYKQGLKLHKAMHENFFPPVKEGENLGGYDWDQSKLTGIFADGKFNCISSAILYLVLARECGLKVKGVLLTSHAFVQLETPDGKHIEVETTTPNGFDWIHDQNFYDKRAGSWFEARGLPKSTFKDYQKREILEPLQLITHNMINQHTDPDRMRPVDRYRLIEARGYVDAVYPKSQQNHDAQMNRLDIYNSEYAYLKKKNEYATLEKMFHKIAPIFPGIHQAWNEDAEMATHVAWLPSEYASTLVKLNRYPEALPWIDSSLVWLNKNAKEGTSLYENNLATLLNMIQSLGKEKQFNPAEGTLARYPQLVKEEPRFRQAAAWLYNAWAVDLWNAGEWEACIVKFDRQLKVTEKENQSAVFDNITGAFLNWAGEHERKGDWADARDVLKQCSERFPDAKKCKRSLGELLAQHSIE